MSGQNTKEARREECESISGTRAQQGETKCGEVLTVRTSLRPEKSGTWRQEENQTTQKKGTGTKRKLKQ